MPSAYIPDSPETRDAAKTAKVKVFAECGGDDLLILAPTIRELAAALSAIDRAMANAQIYDRYYSKENKQPCH